MSYSYLNQADKRACVLSNLQCDDGQCRQDDGYNPEADGNLRFVVAVARLLPQVLALRVQLAVLCAEVVVDRRALKDALLDAPALAQLVVVNLHHHAEALYEEDTAEDRQHQLLVDDDGTHGDDTADGQRTRVAHEHLGRVGVVPEETDERSDEGAEEYHQFL